MVAQLLSQIFGFFGNIFPWSARTIRLQKRPDGGHEESRTCSGLKPSARPAAHAATHRAAVLDAAERGALPGVAARVVTPNPN